MMKIIMPNAIMMTETAVGKMSSLKTVTFVNVATLTSQVVVLHNGKVGTSRYLKTNASDI